MTVFEVQVAVNTCTVQDGPRQTIKHIAYPHGNKDMYDIEEILADSWVQGVQQWHVKWASFGDEADTWQPFEHLAGCEDYIAMFEKQKRQNNPRIEEEEHACKKQKRVEEDAAQPNVVPEQPLTNSRLTSRAWKTFNKIRIDGKQFTDCTAKMDNGSTCGMRLG